MFVTPQNKKNNLIVMMGDSLTMAETLGMNYTDMWPARLRDKLNAAGCTTYISNQGHSGGTSGLQAPGVLARISQMFSLGRMPALFIIEIGTNDQNSSHMYTPSSITQTGGVATVTMASSIAGNFADIYVGRTVTISGAGQSGYNGSFPVLSVNGSTFTYAVPSGTASTATGTLLVTPIGTFQETQNNIQAIIKAAKYGAVGCVGLDTSLPALQFNSSTITQTTTVGTRYIVMNDTSVTGGCPAGPGQTPTITGTATGPTVWECRNAMSGNAGWGRVAVTGTAFNAGYGIPNILVLGQHYVNWSTGGDNGATQYTPWEDPGGLRQYQRQAAAAEGVNYLDLRPKYYSLITSGQFSQGDTLWDFTDLNVHNNQIGNELQAGFVYDYVVNTMDLLSTLST